MNIVIKATQMEMTDAIREYVHKRLEGLDTLASAPEAELLVNVEVGKTSNHHRSGDIFRAEINMDMDGTQLYAVSEQQDLYAAIDEVENEIFGEVKKAKGKQRSLMRRGGKKAKEFFKGLLRK